MNSVQSSVRSLMHMFDGKVQEFINDIDTVHMVWLEEIQQEANRMFSREFNAEPELMPKTPSQKKNSRRKRMSMGHQEENQARRRFSKGKRSNLRGSSVKSLNFIPEEETIPILSTSGANTTTTTKELKRPTRKNKQTAAEPATRPSSGLKTEDVQKKKPELVEKKVDQTNEVNGAEDESDRSGTSPRTPPAIPSPRTPPAIPSPRTPPAVPSPDVVVSISSSDRLSAEGHILRLPSPGRSAAKIAIAGVAQGSRRSSARRSLKPCHSLASLRHSMTQESLRRASRRSMLKRKVSRAGNSTCRSNVDEDSSADSAEEENREAMSDVVVVDTEDSAEAQECKEIPQIQVNPSPRLSMQRVTRSVAANSVALAPPPLFSSEPMVLTPSKRTVTEKPPTLLSAPKSRQSSKRKAPDTVEESPTKRRSPPKKAQSAMRPNMKSFLHTVQKNQMLMMTPNSHGRSATALNIRPKTKERRRLETLEEERMKKMDYEKKRKREELKRKRDERLRRVFEAKVKEEQREVEKKKKIEQKMAQIDDKRMAEDKAKKKVVVKRQEDLEQKRRLEEEAKKKIIQPAEEEKRQQQRAWKLAEARRALEREKELEREQLAASERERIAKEKAVSLERAAREKERRELEEKREALEKRMEERQRLAAEEREAAVKKAAAAAAAAAAQRSVMSTPVGKGGGLNVNVDIEKSPQSYVITPKGGNKPLPKSADDYGMDQNSDYSTDDESAPRKPIPSWAEGHHLQQIIMKQSELQNSHNPPDLDSFFGVVEPPKLENIFYKSKPRYFKRTSSAVWHSPPIGSK